MSVQTEIDRIAANVTAALAACADKGATVPSGSTSDNLAAIIAAIEAGGGDVWVETGTLTKDTYNRIYLPCTKVPDIFILFRNAYNAVSTPTRYADAGIHFNADKFSSRDRVSYLFGYGLNGGTQWLMPYAITSSFNGSEAGERLMCDGNYASGVTYEWIGIGGVA